MPARTFLNHPGEMAARIRDHDWSGHPLGGPADWPDALRVAIDICLGSSFPTAIYWGPELHLLYNDAWAFVPGERHPVALGQPARDVWPDIWDVVGPQFADVLGGQAVARYDQMLPMVRDGIARETYWNYSLSPIRGEGGAICGVFNQGNETTRAVLAERARTAEVERLRELFLQAPGAVALLHGPDFVYEFANAAYSELVGGRPLLGRRLVDALPEVEENFLPLLERVRRTGHPYRADAAVVPLTNGPGGEPGVRLLDFVYQPIKDASGSVTDIFVQANDVTDRAEAEEALRSSEERLQLALDSSDGIGTWDWDVVGNSVTADDRFAALYGVDPAIAHAGAPIDHFFRAVHEDDLPRVTAAIEAALASGVPFAEEYRLVQRDGSVRWVMAQGRPRLDEQGRAVRFPGVSFDVTKRREAEDAAREAAADLRLATEAQAFVFRLAERLRALDSPNAIMRLSTTALGRRLVADRVGFHRTISDGLVQFAACWSSERLAPLSGTMPIAELAPALLASYRAGETSVTHDVARDPATTGAAIARLAGAHIGVPLRRQGRWAATLFVNQATRRHWTPEEVALVEAVAEIAWDAVDRAQVTQALRDSEEKFRAIANSIDQMVWSARPDGEHDYFNDRWYEFTGAPPGSSDGDAWRERIHPDDRHRTLELWRRCLATGEAFRHEYRLRHRDGGYRWVLGSAQPAREEHGRITRWFGTCTDIEEIVEAREVLARSRIDLEAAIAERTSQLMATEAQLRQAQKMEAVGQLTGGIAHDFNNMLAVVIGALDLMERRLAQGRTDLARYLEAARDGAGRAAALTQRLLDFARQTPLAPAAIDINAMMRGMSDLIIRTIGENIVVENQLAPDLWPAKADPSQLENAILNLSVNARDAMPRGGRLSIRTSNQTIDAERAPRLGVEAGDYVEIAVVDTGAGMNEDVAARAFDPFFTTKSVGKGTGLGLSQVFGFVRQSGGHVALITAPGKGTTVCLLLPRDRGGATPRATAAPRAGALPSGHEVVLVVEDDDRVRSFSLEALRELGYAVLEARDGPSALKLLEGGERVHLLFTDVVMPEMTGRELAEAATRIMPGLRVLYTSGYTRDVVEPVAGAVLHKPFDIGTLAARVRAVLDG